jgi:hypothetical protein
VVEANKKIISICTNAIDFSLNVCIFGPINKMEAINPLMLMGSRFLAGDSLNNRYVKSTSINKARMQFSSSFQWLYLNGASKESALYLLSVNKGTEISIDSLANAKKMHAPLLIRIKDKFYIYGNLELKFIKSLSPEETILLNELPFDRIDKVS